MTVFSSELKKTIASNLCAICVLCAQLCRTLCDPMSYIAHQAPLSMEFSRQEYQSGLSFPSRCSGRTRISCVFSILAGEFFTTEPPGKPSCSCSVQLLSPVRLFATPWTVACQGSLSITNSQSLHKLMSIESVMPSNHLIFCRPLLLPPSVFPSISVFSKELILCIRWPKYWSFSFSISPSNEYSGLISFRSDWLDLLAVQGTLKSLLQHHSSKASILWCSVLFIVQVSHPYMTNGKTIALTRWTFVGKVMSLFPLFPHLFPMK